MNVDTGEDNVMGVLSCANWPSDEHLNTDNGFLP